MGEKLFGGAMPGWWYDEARHAGVNYGDAGVAERYDARHLRFRDFEKEAEGIVARLGLGSGDCVIDLGCGTGAFALEAASRCGVVHAVDVSPAMLERCRVKAAERGLENVVTHCAGFLSYVHEGAPADAMVSVAALHHLPDFWKAVALRRMAGMLRPGGRLYLFDVVYSFGVEEAETALDAWVEGIRAGAGDEMAGEAAVHIRDEYSTFEWILDGLLERAGFAIEEKVAGPGGGLGYVCVRI
ncbi:MAG: class I SAM-dependent methyltransferase [FCB group bacterium]|jgi:ubiquinone/menaquinone biosynthesis C-methylase UbiE|nr:class I SAM-dependent methyltransferase [FCB group bacterium]